MGGGSKENSSSCFTKQCQRDLASEKQRKEEIKIKRRKRKQGGRKKKEKTARDTTDRRSKTAVECEAAGLQMEKKNRKEGVHCVLKETRGRV